MKRILFYTANGVGLGHLRRASLVAQSIKQLSPDTEIFFATMCQKTAFLKELGIPYVKLKHLTDNLLENKREFAKAKVSNEKVFLELIRRYGPAIIVFDVHSDFYLFDFPFPKVILSPSFNQIIKILILRKGDKESLDRTLRQGKEIIGQFKKIILPHSTSELKATLPQRIFQEIIKNKKFVISGPIFKKLDLDKIKRCQRRYNISSSDFLITLTLGGGGKLEKGQCQAPNKIINDFLTIFPSLDKKITNLKAIIITGPYFQKINRKMPLGVKVVKFERNLLELIHLSKLVISPAGYNTCNEIIEAKTPAILIPLLRGNNEQFERAVYLKKKGIIRVFDGGSINEFLNLIIDCQNNLDKIRKNFQKFDNWSYDNDKTANEILALLKRS
jgi:predicted glycosyltransferase